MGTIDEKCHFRIPSYPIKNDLQRTNWNCHEVTGGTGREVLHRQHPEQRAVETATA
jgi:hypothetical protein